MTAIPPPIPEYINLNASLLGMTAEAGPVEEPLECLAVKEKMPEDFIPLNALLTHLLESLQSADPAKKRLLIGLGPCRGRLIMPRPKEI